MSDLLWLRTVIGLNVLVSLIGWGRSFLLLLAIVQVLLTPTNLVLPVPKPSRRGLSIQSRETVFRDITHIELIIFDSLYVPNRPFTQNHAFCVLAVCVCVYFYYRTILTERNSNVLSEQQKLSIPQLKLCGFNEHFYHNTGFSLRRKDFIPCHVTNPSMCLCCCLWATVAFIPGVGEGSGFTKHRLGVLLKRESWC